MSEVISLNIDIMEKPKKNINEDIKVTCSSDIVKLKDVQEIRNAVREHLLFIGLDRKNNVRNISLLAIGTTANVTIDSKEIIRIALFSASDKVVLVHNHPTNDLNPSNEDLHLTSVTSEMLKVFNIKLQDHIIVTDKEHISMDKIQKIGKEKNIKSLENMEKGLLLEENQRLKQEIYKLQNKESLNLQLEERSSKHIDDDTYEIDYS